MNGARPLDEVAHIAARAKTGEFDRWYEQVQGTGGCAHPIRLVGTETTVDATTGEVLGECSSATRPDGALLVACGNRRATVCPTCSATYRADTWQLVAAGLRGGKGVPDTVSEHPAVFATFTAPSFGHVHSRRGKGRKRRACRPPKAGEWLWCEHGRPSHCTRTHGKNDTELGSPLCQDCYDYVGAVLFNAVAPELWRRTTIYLRRSLAARVGMEPAALNRQVRVSFTKVAEYQARGVVHFHAVIRVDGFDGEGTIAAPPKWATTELLMSAIRDAARAVAVGAPELGDGVQRTLCWGSQLDIRPIHRSEATANPAAIAAYIAKYATKAADALTGGLTTRLRDLSELDAYRVTTHVRRLIGACWQLGRNPDLAELKLRRWAHMLGFGGHFSTRSRRYSVTLTALRRSRAAWRRHDASSRAVVSFGRWRYVGTGYATVGDASLAATIAANRLHAAEEARAQRRAESRLMSFLGVAAKASLVAETAGEG